MGFKGMKHGSIEHSGKNEIGAGSYLPVGQIIYCSETCLIQ